MGKEDLQKMAEVVTGKKSNEVSADKGSVPTPVVSGTFKFIECVMEPTGDICCKITKQEFEKVNQSGVTAKRFVYEITD